MTSPAALLRLVWRAPTLVVVLPLALAVIFPLALLEAHAPNPLAALWQGGSDPVVRQAAWQLVVLIPAAVGLVTAIHRLELQHTIMGWMLPGARSGVAVGSATVAAPVAALLAVLVGRGSTPAVAAAAFALALFWFVLPGHFMDVTVPRAVRWGGLGMLALAAFQPELLWQAAETQPAITGALALAGFATLLHAQQSAARARQRPLAWSLFSGGSAQGLYWSRPGRAGPLWHDRLTTSRIVPWLRAAAYESGSRYPRAHVVQAAVAVLLAHLMNMPFMLIIFAASDFASSGMQLGGAVHYPLSRSRRADLAFAGALLDAVALCGTMALLLPLSRWIPVLPLFAEETSMLFSGTLGVGVAFALAPVAQWPHVRRASRGSQQLRSEAATHFGFMAGYMVIAAGTAVLVARSGIATHGLAQAAVIAALAIAVYGCNWLTLHRFFARADLARGRA